MKGHGFVKILMVVAIVAVLFLAVNRKAPSSSTPARSDAQMEIDNLHRADMVRLNDGTLRFVLEVNASRVSLSRCVECAPEIWTRESFEKSYSFRDSVFMRYGNGNWQSALNSWAQTKK